MQMIKQILWRIKCHPASTLIHIITLYLIGSLVIGSICLNNAAQKKLTNERNLWKLNVILQSNIEAIIKNKKSPNQNLTALTLDQAEKIASLPMVHTANYYISSPVFGKNITSISTNKTARPDQPDFQLEGVYDLSQSDDFIKEINTLVKGNPINSKNKNQKVAIIEQKLANLNNLQIGDSITIEDQEKAIASTFVIIGIFQTSELKKTGIAGQITFLQPENKIYVPVSTLVSLKSNKHTIDYAIYSLKSPDQFDQFRRSAIQNGISVATFKFYKDDAMYNQKSAPIKEVITLSKLFIFSTISIGIVFIFFTAKRILIVRQSEVRTLFFLGKTGRKIFGQFLLEMMTIVIFSFGLAIIAAPKMIHSLDYLLRTNPTINPSIQSNYIFQSDNTNPITTLFALQISPNVRIVDLILVVLIGIIISVVGSAFPYARILGVKKSNLLLDGERSELR